MDSRYDPSHESDIYSLWQKSKIFSPSIPPKPKKTDKQPFSIILPLPNANDPMHMGHAMFVIEDIMVRFHKMLGYPVMWLPGADHAGIETQFVFEKNLAKTGQSRFDFDRNTLYKMIWDFVEENRKLNQFQLKQLGFALDWSRYHYSLEPGIIKQVLSTFKKMHHHGLLYRDDRIVNYCTHCGTAFSDLEIDHQQRSDFLYYLDYGPISIATTRPETIFVDVAVAVNPKDKRYKKLVGQTATIPLTNKQIPIIADDLVEKDFGTGALKITPAHDTTDFEIGQKHKLALKSCIKHTGQMYNTIPEIDGLYPKQARAKTIELLQKAGKLIKTEPLTHTVSVCYRCKNIIEPLPVPQWYVKTTPLAKPVIKSVKSNQTTIFPLRFRKVYLDWMENIKDWNISRQNVWGPRLPAWYCLDCNQDIQLNFITKDKKVVSDTYANLKKKFDFNTIRSGLQTLTAPINSTYFIDKPNTCPKCGGKHILQETDTFDTWFLSGQWPLTTLGFNVEDPAKSHPDFNYFYPTSFMDTLWDILFFWVGRMQMFGYYLAGDTPFKTIHLHAKVTDDKGQKMSKSKGNVINPSDVVEKYGADALRFALVYGVAPASDISLSDKKIESMRNFVNKIWNASRFVTIIIDKFLQDNPHLDLFTINKINLKPDDKKVLKELDHTINSVTAKIKKYHFGQATEVLYAYFWHYFCDIYIEQTKDRGPEVAPVLLHCLLTSLKLLHPFVPFVTESIYQQLRLKLKLTDDLLASSSWPKTQT